MGKQHEEMKVWNLRYEGPSTLRANQLFRAVLTVSVGSRVEPGGQIVIATRHFSDLMDPQMENPRAENYIAVDCSREGVRWGLGPAEGPRHPWNRGIDLRPEGAALQPGDVVSIRLGPEGEGCPGYRCQSFMETHFGFRLGIDPTGEGEWIVAEEGDLPGFRVTGNVATALRATVPQCTAGARQVRCHLKCEDAYGNVAGEVTESPALVSAEDGSVLAEMHLEPHRAVECSAAFPAEERYRRLTVTTRDGALSARSNPIGPSPLEGYELFWGEIHSQSCLCDGTNSPEELYEHARGPAALDFASVTSHGFELTGQNWRQIQSATRRAHRPGEFVTFLGYEWSGNVPAGGDHNIYFFEDEGPLVYSAPCPGIDAWDPARGEVEGSRNLAQTIELLRDHRIMVIPHCGGRRCNFDFYDPRVMPLFEIHSCHRTYEVVAHEAIERGLRVGFIGGSDDHRGAVGDSHAAARDRFFSSHSGLVAAYARELTREALWEAFFARRVYATNGPRTILHTSINGTPMGGELKASPKQELTMRIFACGDGLLDRIDLFCDTESVAMLGVEGRGNKLPQREEEIKLAPRPGAHCYYVRVRQVDGGLAWSSPIWVEVE